MNRRLSVGLVLTGLVLTGCSSPAGAVNERPGWAPDGYAPCVTESSNGCYWDAGVAGNGEGVSWWADPEGNVTYPFGEPDPVVNEPAVAEAAAPKTPTPSRTVATSPVPVPTVSEAPATADPGPRPTTAPLDPGVVYDWTGDNPPEPGSLPECQHADSDACFYPGRELGDRCDWVNSPDLVTTWFFNCDDPALNGRVQ